MGSPAFLGLPITLPDAHHSGRHLIVVTTTYDPPRLWVSCRPCGELLIEVLEDSIVEAAVRGAAGRVDELVRSIEAAAWEHVGIPWISWRTEAGDPPVGEGWSVPCPA